MKDRVLIIGHVDHRRASLAAAVTRVLVDAAPIQAVVVDVRRDDLPRPFVDVEVGFPKRPPDWLRRDRGFRGPPR